MTVVDYEPTVGIYYADGGGQFAFDLNVDGQYLLTPPHWFFLQVTASIGLQPAPWGFTLLSAEGSIPVSQAVAGPAQSQASFFPGDPTYDVLAALATGSRRISGVLIGGLDQPSHVRLTDFLLQAVWNDDFPFIYQPGTTMTDIEDLATGESGVEVTHA